MDVYTNEDVQRYKEKVEKVINNLTLQNNRQTDIVPHRETSILKKVLFDAYPLSLIHRYRVNIWILTNTNNIDGVY